MADDQNPQDPQVSATTTDQSANADTNQPISANSPDVSTDLSAGTSAQEDSTQTSPADSPSQDNRPDSFTQSQGAGTISTYPLSSPNLPNTPNLTNDSTVAPSLPPQQNAPALDINISSDLSNPSDLPDIPVVEGVKGDDIDISIEPNQAPEVQSEAPSDASIIEPPQQTEKMAEIKPEPPQNPTIPSTPSQSPNSSFGDILSGNTNPAPPAPSQNLNDLSNSSGLPVSSVGNSQPTIPPPRDPASGGAHNQFTSPKPDVSGQGGQPSVSFGDLIKDIKPEETVIQPPPVQSAPVSPPVIPSPNPLASPKPDISGEGGQPTTNNSQPILPPSPISPQSPISSQLDQKLKEELSLRRQKANQKRHQKKEEMLNKLVALVQSRGKITNREAQKILHLPQSTLTDYFKELVTSGRLKLFGRKRGIYYTV